MDLFLSVGTHAANSTNKNAQTRTSNHSRILSISNPKIPLPTTPTAAVQPPPEPRRTRRVTILGPGACQMKSSDPSAQGRAQMRATSPPSAVENKSWKTFQSRQPRPSHPPTSWKGGYEDCSDGEDRAPEILCNEPKRTLPETTSLHALNPNDKEQSIGTFASSRKLSESSSDVSTSTENPTFCSATTPGHMLPDRTVREHPGRYKISSDSPNPSGRNPGIPTRSESTTQISPPNTQELKAPRLPDPEIAYGQMFYYTACPHASPPCSRPLNVQPTLVTYHENLLRYAPFHLRVAPLDPAPEIYILEGACSQCDLAARREAEIKVLDKYKSKVDVLSSKLYELQGDIDVDSPTLPRECYSGISRPLPHSDAVTDNTEVVFTAETIAQILSIETDLESLIKRRDREIRFIWRGYTARWGPATLGVFRNQLHPVTRTMQNAAAGNAECTLSQSAAMSDNESVVSTTTKSSSGDRSSSSFTDSSSATTLGSSTTGISSTRRQRTHSSVNPPAFNSRDTPQSRYSNGRRSVPLPPPVDGTKQEGRMQIDWVRRGCDLWKGKQAEHVKLRETTQPVK
jgi:hypothetical protein